MTAGATLYLVSACGSAEEFVAAFRRYADRTGLFVPSSTPLPAGRRGRLALTLKDGGVMIEGEAEILQSSQKPTVLYGRPGMTIKFVAPDEPSKIVIGELEKARLAMKPAPPSVPPRPADVPAEPRPTVPPIGGRIDASNALAECVVIGDSSTLQPVGGAPKSVTDSPSGKSKFLPSAVPSVGARSGSPSTPPPMQGRPRTPSTPPELHERPRTPSTPPDPASRPLPQPANVPASKLPPSGSGPAAKPIAPPPGPAAASAQSSKLTSIGFPAIDKAPAAPAPAAPAPTTSAPTTSAPTTSAKPTHVSADNPGMRTTPGTGAPANATRPMSSSVVALVDEEATTIGEIPHEATAKSTDPMPATAAPAADKAESTTLVGTPPVAIGAPAPPPAPRPIEVPNEESSTLIGAPPVAATAPKPAEPSGLIAPPPPPAPAPPTPRAPVAPLPSVASSSQKHQQKATSIGFPAIRTPFETQPLGLVPPAAGSEPAPPVMPRSGERSNPGAAPRGKNPTRPPLSPRHPTPVAPVPIVRSPAKSAPHVEDELTDLNASMQATPAAGKAPETVVAAAAYTDAAKAADAAVTSPQRSGGMRASEILAAIPTADWTMSPDASKPTVMPSRGWTPHAGQKAVKADGTPVEPAQTPSPSPKGPPKGPPTGDWTISLDPEAPEAGWSEPAKPVAEPRHPTGGNPDIAVSSDKPINAVEWEEKPTGLGEAKIEIDPTLMEPLKPMPDLDEESLDPLASPPAPDEPSPFAARPLGRAGTAPLAGIAALDAAMRTPSGGAQAVASIPRVSSSTSGPLPLVGSSPSGSIASLGAPSQQMSAPGLFAPGATSTPASGLPTTPATQSLFDGNSQVGMFGFAPQQSGFAPVASGSSAGARRKLLILVAALAAVAAGFALVLLLSATKHTAPTPKAGTGSQRAIGSADATPGSGSTMPTGSAGSDVAAGSGSDAPVDDDGSAGSAGSAVAAVDVTPRTDAAVPEVAPLPTGPCKVTVTSIPSAADILIDGAKQGTTPGELELPCGVEAKLTLRKAKFANTARSVTPDAAKANKVVVKLTRMTFTLKVTSTPAGATITAGGRPHGVTPATIRLPAYEGAAIVLSKPGYASDTKTITPKSNNTSHHVTLKKGGKR